MSISETAFKNLFSKLLKRDDALLEQMQTEVNHPTSRPPLPVRLTAHAILRYLERHFKIDVGLIRFQAMEKLGHRKHQLKFTEIELLKYIERRMPDLVDTSRADLAYYCKGKVRNFEQDEMTFIVKDNTLVTVYFKTD